MEASTESVPMEVDEQAVFSREEDLLNGWFNLNITSVNGADPDAAVEFKTTTDLTNFKKQHKDSDPGVDPFKGNPVILYPSDRRYWDMAQLIFQKLGVHVTALVINTGNWENGDRPVFFYMGLNSLLKHLPNLTSLEFIQEDEFQPNKEEGVKVKKHFKQNPLPSLPSLRSLLLSAEMEEIFKREILQSWGKQVDKLATVGEKWISEHGPFPSLKELCIFNVADLGNLAEEMLNAGTFPKLNKLELRLETHVGAKQLFRILEPLRLQGLKLSFANNSILCKCPDEKCDAGMCEVCRKSCGGQPFRMTEVVDPKKPGPGILASIEALKISGNSPFQTFHFLKYMPALKALEVDEKMAMGRKANKLEEIGEELGRLVRGKIEDPQESLIWKLLRSLKVLKVGDFKVERRQVGNGNKYVDLFEEVFPQLFCDLKIPDYEKMRVVCKTWREVIDHFIQNHPIYRPFHLEAYLSVEQVRHYDCHLPENLNARGYCGPQAFESVTKSSGGFPDNPFYSRHIALSHNEHHSTKTEFWDTVATFLEKVGVHIWYLTWNQQQIKSPCSELFFYKTLLRCLNLLPNLKALTFDGDMRVVQAVGSDAKKLEAFLAKNPLPKLDHFETFTSQSPVPALPTYWRTHDAILEAYGSQLGRLEMYGVMWKPKYGQLPKLTQFSVNRCCVQGLQQILCSLEAPKLQKLEIQLASDVDENYLLGMLQPFDTVRVLTILIASPIPTPPPFGMINLGSIPGADGYRLIERKEGEEPTILPNVQHLYIRTCHRHQRFQFLKNFPALRILTARTSKFYMEKDDDIGKELDECRKGGKRARESQIWKELPKLEWLHLLPGTKMDRSGYVYIDRQWKSPLMFPMNFPR